jgi:hypothetical protein
MASLKKNSLYKKKQIRKTSHSTAIRQNTEIAGTIDITAQALRCTA